MCVVFKSIHYKHTFLKHSKHLQELRLRHNDDLTRKLDTSLSGYYVMKPGEAVAHLSTTWLRTQTKSFYRRHVVAWSIQHTELQQKERGTLNADFQILKGKVYKPFFRGSVQMYSRNDKGMCLPEGQSRHCPTCCTGHHGCHFGFLSQPSGLVILEQCFLVFVSNEY